jgi:CRP-like cAMP-binding protein
VGEIELLRGGDSIATVRACLEEGAEVAALDPAEFATLIAQSEAAEAAIGQIADERLAESRARREAGDA